MPFRVLGLDFKDLPKSLLAPSSPERPFLKGAKMLRLKDQILTERPSPAGIELPVLHEPESLEMPPSYAGIGQHSEKPVVVENRMMLHAVKNAKSFDWVGSRSALPAILRQMEKYGWAVTVREERPLDHA